MTSMKFGLSAAFPGQTEGQPWDVYWTPFSTDIAWVDNIMWVGGAPGLNVNTYTGSVDVPTYDVPLLEQQTVIGIAFGGASVPPDPVTVDSFLADQSPVITEQDIKLTTGWNSVKDIEVSSISANILNVTGFVDTWINAPTDNAGHTVFIHDAKRGAVALGDGDDSVLINVASNEYTWSSTFDIVVGDGNDAVAVRPDDYSAMAELSAPAGYTFNSAPQLTTANVTVGNGDDAVTLMEVSGTIHVGNGNDTISITDGNSAIWLGSGNDTVTVSGENHFGAASFAYDLQPGALTVHFGIGQDDIFIDDLYGPPVTTLRFMQGNTEGNAPDPTAVVRVGHYNPDGSFAGGALENYLFIDTSEFPWQDPWTLSQGPNPGEQLLQVHDSSTGSVVDTFALYGAELSGVDSLGFTSRS
jgi:hypothetical protein